MPPLNVAGDCTTPDKTFPADDILNQGNSEKLSFDAELVQLKCGIKHAKIFEELIKLNFLRGRITPSSEYNFDSEITNCENKIMYLPDFGTYSIASNHGHNCIHYLSL